MAKKKQKNVRFKISGEQWDIPLPTFILLIIITLALMGLGAWLGFKFGSGSL